MIVTILGSGTGTPSLRRSSCATMVETTSSRMLFDLGPGTLRRLVESGSQVNEVSHVVLTHFHPDHCADLVPFLFALKSPEWLTRRKLTLVGGVGLNDLLNGLTAVFGHWIQLPPDDIEIIELCDADRPSVVFEDSVLTFSRMNHNRESLAFRLESHGRSLVISGDTDVCDALISLSRDADMLICESSTPDEYKIEGHLTPSLAGKMASDACVKRLVLTHFYPLCDKSDIAKQGLKTYDGPLFLAEDLMKFYV